jgi:glycosyltransferase involved in cell wall biosynthesis
MEALRNARSIITPHTKIASMFPRRGELLDWSTPVGKPMTRRRNSKPYIVFPASTVGRKGCYELRDALRVLDVKLVILGPVIESPNFWKGSDVESGTDDWMSRADVVVLPAFVEHRPRRLIAAAAAGIPVVASKACGVENIPGIRSIAAGDAVILREEILAALSNTLSEKFREQFHLADTT